MNNATRQWFVLAAVVGCGGSQAAGPSAMSADDTSEAARIAGPQNTVVKRGSGKVQATLGPGGGSLELDEGPRVKVPAGAVSGGQDFVLKLAQKTTAFSNKESEKPLGPTFSFAPDLNAPDGNAIEVSFPLGTLPEGWGEPSIAYEVDKGDVVGGEDSTRTGWQYERATLSGGRVVAQLPSVTGLRMQFVLTNLEAQ